MLGTIVYSVAIKKLQLVNISIEGEKKFRVNHQLEIIKTTRKNQNNPNKRN